MKKINCASVEKKIINYLQKKVGRNKVIIGLSGGIDSSIVAILAVKALGKNNVKVLIVNNSRYSKEGLDIARNYARINKLELQEVSTEEIRRNIVQNLKMNSRDVILNSTLDARICDLIIKEVANLENRIYLGTINGTERITGWYPKGALVGDFNPIGGLLKSQEKDLAIYLGLEHLIETVSETADRICSGCGELEEFKGISYSVLDEVLYLYETSLQQNLKKKLKMSGVSPKIYNVILERIKKVEHKLDVFPCYCSINSKN